MEHPVKEITGVIRALTQGSRQEQQDALYGHYLPDAAFVHPFCRVPRFAGVAVPGVGEINSRMVILAIFRWYKILSPRIELEIESSVFDQRAGLLYVTIHQTFVMWFIPFYKAPVRLVTVLHLVQPQLEDDGSHAPGPSAAGKNGVSAMTNSEVARPARYMIAAQEDLYQVNEFVKFILPGIGAPLWYLFQVFSTFLCALGVPIMTPVMALLAAFAPQLRQKDT